MTQRDADGPTRAVGGGLAQGTDQAAGLRRGEGVEGLRVVQGDQSGRVAVSGLDVGHVVIDGPSTEGVTHWTTGGRPVARVEACTWVRYG